MPRRTLIMMIAVASVVLAAASSPAAAPLPGAVSLRRMTHDADAVVVARITIVGATVTAGGSEYPVVHADVLATLKGAPAPGGLAFAIAGPGTASHVVGEEVLLFLQSIERVAGLAATPLASRIRYAAIPNAGEKIVVRPRERDALLGAVRGYVAVDTIPDPEGRAEALRRLTLEVLQSGEPLLVTSVMRDFAPGGDAAALTLADLPALVPLIESPRVPIGTRIALVAELERRGLVFGPARWVRLLRTARGSDLLAVIRAVGEHPSAGVNAQLIPLLHHRDFAVATAAATALGVPGNVEAVRALAESLGRADAELRTAALSSLARVGTQSARQALELAAARHPDPLTRRHAESAAIVLARRHGTTLAPMLALPNPGAALASR